jgi:hypothetical protein
MRDMIEPRLIALILLLLFNTALLAQTTTQGTATGQGTQSNGNPIAPTQSLAPTPDVCSAGSQSVRVCNNDFQSCSSVCNGLTLSDPTADVAGCSLRCCSQFNACLSIRGCGTGTVNCF